MGIKIREKQYSSGERVFYLDIYHKGKRWTKFISEIRFKKNERLKRKEAQELASAIKTKIEFELAFSENGIVNSKKTSDEDFLKYFKDYIDKYNKADIRMFKYTLEKLKGFLNGKKILFKDVQPTLVIDFRDFLYSKNSKLSGSTPYDYFKKFKKVLKYATIDNKFLSNPAENIFGKKIPKSRIKEVLTNQEL